MLKKTATFIAIFLMLLTTVFADVVVFPSPEDETQIQNEITLIENALSKGDPDSILNKLSPNARAGLREELDANLRGREIRFRQEISSIEESSYGSFQVKVRGRLYAAGRTESGMAWEINGLSDYYIFEKSRENWLLVDTNFHQKLDAGYILKFLGKIFLIIFIVSIPLMIFWIWMLVDCIRREFDSKVTWIILVALTGIIGAAIYYFVIKKKNKNKVQEKPMKKTTRIKLR